MARDETIERVSFVWTEDNGATFQILEFLATISEQHSVTTRFTEHAIEDGSVVTDHVRPELDRLSISVLVTDTPTGAFADDVNGATIDAASGATNLFTEEVARVESIYEQLRTLSRSGIVLDVATSLRNYGSMVITEMATPRNSENSHSISLDVNLREVEFATLEIEQGRIPVSPRANRQKTNNRPTGETNASEQAKADEKTTILGGFGFGA